MLPRPEDTSGGLPVTCERCGFSRVRNKNSRRRRRVLCDFCRSILAGGGTSRHLTWAEKWAQEVRDRGLAKGARCDFSAGGWRRALAYFNRCCAYCGSDEKLTRDHVVPISRGGEHTASNVVPACGACNRAKGDQSLEVFADPETVHRIRTYFASLA